MYIHPVRQCFRPLDGESISKPTTTATTVALNSGFRPLDGESISKLIMMGNTLLEDITIVSVP